MKLSGTLKLISISILAISGLAACDNRGPSESAGQRMDSAAGNNSDSSAANTGQSQAGQSQAEQGQTADNIGDSMQRQGQRAGQALDDATITARVKAALFAEPSLKALQINVDTSQGVVSLSGSVDSLQESNRAKELASSVEGVRIVENRLSLK